ncbi:hypothetical protein DBR27_22520 [Flavobacterium sp. HMWF030]|nr:hypothetical protein DBR27_22520 [Flavobacterium sp. HMWF030]
MEFFIQSIYDKKLCRSAYIMRPLLILFLILQLVVCPLRGQALQKEQVRLQDYGMWSDLRLTNVSPNNKWVSYLLDYENQTDTVFVRSTTTNAVYHYTDLKHCEFLDNDRFASFSKDRLSILNLKIGNTKNILGVKNYSYSAKTNMLAVLARINSNSNLSIIDCHNKVIQKVESVSSFLMSPDGQKIIYITESGTVSSLRIMYLQSGFPQKLISENSSEVWDTFVWQEHSKSLSFFQRNRTDNLISISYYDLAKGVVTHLKPNKENILKDKFITEYYKYPLSISSDGERVFFCVGTKLNEQKTNIKSSPEIWYTKVKEIYSLQEHTLPLKNKPRLAVWFPKTNKIDIISSDEFPEVFVTGDERYALLANPLTYEPTFEDGAPRDFYIKDLKTGKQRLLAKNIEDYKRNLLPSPTGKYVAYFFENNWWIYNTANQTHKNITEKIGIEFSGLLYSQTSKSPYGNPGWTLGDKEIILYSKYDIWAIKPNESFRKLTSGNGAKIQFRIAYNLGGDFRIPSFEGFKSSNIQINKNLILRADGEDAKSGYFTWNKINKEQSIVYEASYIDQMHFDANTNSYIYQRQNFNKSPYLVYQYADKTSRVFFENNKYESEYNWGTSELIEFKNSKGSLLRAALYYPADFKPEKKYPMIVHIYEKQSHDLHKFRRPTLLEYAGFNRTVLSLEGYFVLCPDIEHEVGKVGKTTVDCVTAATKAVIDKGLVNPKQIGLMGHSFGGYEAAIVVTQTNMFAAAIAGAAITDLTSAYLSINWDTGKANMKRFKKEQYRLGVTPFEEPLVYLKNSPITAAADINKPLLLWSGKKDQQVDWHQSIELYLAMHRLDKKNIMLLYPNEGHSITNPENQKDLLTKILQWFDHFLKNETPAEWIKKRSL